MKRSNSLKLRLYGHEARRWMYVSCLTFLILFALSCALFAILPAGKNTNVLVGYVVGSSGIPALALTSVIMKASYRWHNRRRARLSLFEK